MPGTYEYVSTINGVTRKSAVPGSAFDERLARSRRWKRVGPGVELDERTVEVPDEAEATVDEPAPVEDQRAAIAERRAQRRAEREAQFAAIPSTEFVGVNVVDVETGD